MHILFPQRNKKFHSRESGNLPDSNWKFAKLNCAAFAIFICTIFVLPGAAFAEEFADPRHEKRYYALVKTLRCLVCQNQTLAESNADLAADMRAVVAEMVRDGAQEAEVVGFMKERYGDFVHYRPPFNFATLALWFAPFALAAVLVLFLLPKFFRRRAAIPAAAEMQKADSILAESLEKKTEEKQ